jgi:hypothetical protein
MSAGGELAASKDATVSQLALAWLLAQGPDVVPGTREPGAGGGERACGPTCTAADIERIAQILPHGWHGARFAEGLVPVWE